VPRAFQAGDIPLRVTACADQGNRRSRR
jgi:hypothetical protein